MDKSNSKMYISQFGTKIYKNLNRKLHRLNGPAIEFVDGEKRWYIFKRR